MTDLGEFIAARLDAEATAEELAADVLAYLRGDEDMEAVMPTLSEVMREEEDHAVKIEYYMKDTYMPGSGHSYPERKSRTTKRSTEETDEAVAAALLDARQTVARLHAVQALRAANTSNPSWWRRALGLV